MSKNCVEGSTEKKNDEERINKNVKEDYLICSTFYVYVWISMKIPEFYRVDIAFV